MPDTITLFAQKIANDRLIADLNLRQAHLDANRHSLEEAVAWEIQADIDTKRFEAEIIKLSLATQFS